LGLTLKSSWRNKGVDIGANVFSRVGRLARERIEIAAFLLRSIVGEIPDIIESVGRPGGASLDVDVLFLVDVHARFQSVLV